jgi:hypothetical protein
LKKINFSRDSWHARFVAYTTLYFEHKRREAERNGHWEGEGTNARWISDPIRYDICEYTRAFIAGIIKCILIGIVAIVIGTPLIGGLAYSFLWLFNHGIKIPPIAAAGMVIWACGMCVITIFGITEGVSKLISNRTQKPPSAMKIMYKNWKEKTCSLINFT